MKSRGIIKYRHGCGHKTRVSPSAGSMVSDLRGEEVDGEAEHGAAQHDRRAVRRQGHVDRQQV